ncbi:MAG: hypothetical protein Kapaf2KO_17340 [Candidatus Kapaibacteriales bacterium]
MSKYKYKTIPGRGINSEFAQEERIEFLRGRGIDTSSIEDNKVMLDDVKNKIESFIGTVELPLGLIGPLSLSNQGEVDNVYSAIATTEGALVASINRGAKALSKSGGFKSYVLRQNMTRCPMFVFECISDCIQFQDWILKNINDIKELAESYSNHAVLKSIEPQVISKSVHLMFNYYTGDASGQNMTTKFTWHSCLYILERVQSELKIQLSNFVLEGNGNSDKKMSFRNTIDGRGISVVAECILEESVINKVLRTDSDALYSSFRQSVPNTIMNGMFGYNINVANVIAGIYASTGQDLASIGESSFGVLNLEKIDGGLYLSLNLTNLVVGTIGGGTNLPAQTEILELMGCRGKDKVSRFAMIISGFALSLEISTLSAIVSGQFARAHEKLGRNKPVNWLNKYEIDNDFISSMLNGIAKNSNITTKDSLISIDNGILTSITSKVNNKVVGFIPLHITIDNTGHEVVLKSKPLDIELIQGIHLLASNLDSSLADEIKRNYENLEYKNSHIKELQLYKHLARYRPEYIPKYYGELIIPEREIYLVLIEKIHNEILKIQNSENRPDLWSNSLIKKAIRTIDDIHKLNRDNLEKIDTSLYHFDPTANKDLYHKMITIIKDNENTLLDDETTIIFQNALSCLSNYVDKKLITIIHNDFNSRNMFVDNNNNIIIYDWELSVLGCPTRDIVEFLCFVLENDFTKKELLSYIEYHYELNNETGHTYREWLEFCRMSLIVFMITRLSFYLLGQNYIDYSFTNRVTSVSFRILEIFDEELC